MLLPGLRDGVTSKELFGASLISRFTFRAVYCAAAKREVLILSLRTLYVGSLGLLMPCCNQQEGVPVCGSCDFSKQEACGDTYSACTGTLCAQHRF